MDLYDEKFDAAFFYPGDDLGAVWTPTFTSFRLWAPTASSVEVALYSAGNDGTLLGQYPMVPAAKGTWVYTAQGNLHGIYYSYLVTRNGQTVESVDPYARAGGVNGLRGMVIDLHQTDPVGWAEDLGPRIPITDATIWEVHVRDFSQHFSSGMQHKGKYLAFTEEGTHTAHGIPTGLSHLKKLGITHVQLLPIFDYGSVDESSAEKRSYNWGYDPVNFNFPEGSYASDPFHGEVRIRELKEAIASLHKNGIGVIMDVVYNHVYDRDSFCLNKIVPGYFSRGSSNGSCCGNDTATERNMVRKFVIDSLCYWATEYHLDGFRFDLAGIMDVETLRQAAAELQNRCPGLLLYGEGWKMSTAPTRPDTVMAVQSEAPQMPGFGFFNDTIRDLMRGPLFEEYKPGFLSGAHPDLDKLESAFCGNPDWTEDPKQSINYISCHDNFTLADRISLSLPEATTEMLARRNRLGAAFVLLSQGIPFFQAGEEFLRSKPNGRGGFVDNSFRSSDRVNAMRWNRMESPEVQKTRDYYAGLIALRKSFPLFRLPDRTTIRHLVAPFHTEASYLPAFQLKDDHDCLLVFFNPEEAPQSVTLPVGIWNVLVWDQHAGTEILFQASGTLLLPPVSVTVFAANKTETEILI